MSAKIYNVLVLCTGNSARSILAEALLNRLGQGKVIAYSAGSQPNDEPNPYGLKLLQDLGYDTGSARSKSWDEFAGDEAPDMDLIFTVCDSAAAEACPAWPGHPITVHWGIPDPAVVFGSEREIKRAFETAYDQLEHRVTSFLELPIDDTNPSDLAEALREIGRN